MDIILPFGLSSCWLFHFPSYLLNTFFSPPSDLITWSRIFIIILKTKSVSTQLSVLEDRSHYKFGITNFIFLSGQLALLFSPKIISNFLFYSQSTTSLSDSHYSYFQQMVLQFTSQRKRKPTWAPACFSQCLEQWSWDWRIPGSIPTNSCRIDPQPRSGACRR